MNDVVFNKIARIERSIQRVNEVYEGNGKNLEHLTKQDSIILNIRRAYEACIDLAMYVISERKLGVPNVSHEGFEILRKANVIEGNLVQSFLNIEKFLSVAIHDPAELNLDKLQMIVEGHLDNFKEFTKIIIQLDL